jgi:hypothetical protein
MATYIPGIESYTPTYTPFEPDFKFAQAVLSTRQDRYDTNYKQLNDVYGSVIYADLSREDTTKQRDDFANKLVPSIEKIAEMDLSIGANVDAARAVFNPFIENNLIQQDIYRTARYKGEMQRAQSLLNAPNPDANKQYWQTGIDYLNYQMEDFVNASPEEALRQPMPKYVPNANLYDMALDYLRESGIEVEDFHFTKDNRFIIKQKNGELIYDASYDRVKRALAQNAKVQQAYAADSYVKARRHAETGVKAGKYQTINDGRVAWAQDILADINFKATQLQLKHEGKIEELNSLKLRHESANQGVNPDKLSPREKRSYEEVLMNLKEVEEENKSNQTLLQSMGTMTSDQESLLNRAYATLMNWNISDDLRAAAKSYSMESASREPIVNQFQLENDRHRNAMIRDAANNAFKAEEGRLNRANELKAAGVLMDPSLQAAFDKLQLAGAGSVDYVKDEDGKPNADTDIYKQYEEIKADAGQKVLANQIETIKLYHQIDQGSLKDGKGTPESIVVNGKIVGIGDLRTELMKPENKNWLDQKHEAITAALKNDESRAKYASHISSVDAARIKNSLNTTEGLALRIEKATGEFNSRAAKNWSDVLNFSGLAGVTEVKEEIEEFGAPEIVKNGKVLSEDEFVEEALKLAKDKKYIDSVRLNEPFYSPAYGYNTDNVMDSGIGLTVTGYKFDPAWAEKSARALYAKQKGVLNRTLNGFYNYDTSVADPENKKGQLTSFKPYGAYTMFRGGSVENMTDETAFMANSYNAAAVGAKTWEYLNPESKAVVVDLITQVGAGGVQYIPGDAMKQNSSDVKEYTAEQQDKAKRMVGQALMDFRTGTAGGDTKNEGLFSVSYIDAYGPIDSETKSGAYVITFDQAAINKSIGLTGDNAEGTGIITKQEKDAYSTITVIVNKDQDVSGYSQSNYNYSAVDTKIDFEGKYERDVPNAGKFKIWKDGDVYLTTIEQKTFDPTAKTDDHYVISNSNVVPLVYPSTYGDRAGKFVTPNDVQQIADYMEYVRLAKILEDNAALEKAYKTSNQ